MLIVIKNKVFFHIEHVIFDFLMGRVYAKIMTNTKSAQNEAIKDDQQHSTQIACNLQPYSTPGTKAAIDRQFRQMAYYFDHGSYQDRVNQQGGSKSRPKFTKREIEQLKNRKREQKKKRMLAWLKDDNA